MVCVNDYAMIATINSLPFGGCKVGPVLRRFCQTTILLHRVREHG